jgi:hypothetical protein
MKDLPRIILDDDGSDVFRPQSENTTTSGLRTDVLAMGMHATRSIDEYYLRALST